MIFVFGSNLAGRHGKGAALLAKQKFGAVTGVGKGMQGLSYAIPTKGKTLQTLPLREIEMHVMDFAHFARQYKHEIFMLTPIGTGLAGYTKEQMLQVVKRVRLPSNVVLASSWVDGDEIS